MNKRQKSKAVTTLSLNVVTGSEANSTIQSRIFLCDSHHIGKVVQDLLDSGTGLDSTKCESQRSTLLRALKYLGAQGLNTYEGTAAGYVRLATRILELKRTGWTIITQRENVTGPDGLFHLRIARYVLLGKAEHEFQMQLPLEAA